MRRAPHFVRPRARPLKGRRVADCADNCSLALTPNWSIPRHACVQFTLVARSANSPPAPLQNIGKHYNLGTAWLLSEPQHGTSLRKPCARTCLNYDPDLYKSEKRAGGKVQSAPARAAFLTLEKPCTLGTCVHRALAHVLWYTPRSHDGGCRVRVRICATRITPGQSEPHLSR